MLQNNHGDDFHVDIDYDPKINDVNYWKQYDIVHFHRSIGQDYNIAPTIIQNLNNLGIVTIMDLDDYWLPTKEHPVHQLVLQNKLHEKILANMKVAGHVITTTSIFATEISKYNKNVYVLPNAINPNEPQFQAETKSSEKLRFGWLGGSSHLHDLKLLDGTLSTLTQFKDNFSMYLCGFDTRGTVTEINQQTGEQKQRPINPEETVWARYEEIFTDKLVAFALRPNRLKNRDLWDIAWLHQQRINPALALLKRKLMDHHVESPFYVNKFSERSASLMNDPEIANEFRKEMSRFLPNSTVKETVQSENFWVYLSNLMESYRQQLIALLEGNGHTTEFKM